MVIGCSEEDGSKAATPAEHGAADGKAVAQIFCNCMSENEYNKNLCLEQVTDYFHNKYGRNVEVNTSNKDYIDAYKKEANVSNCFAP
ncbi:hypothetical protein FACS189456_5660 [Bacteroidia bacterium]|nr:hypothetical protein FACS189456_5660 [Bacteroidia bacterium]